MSDSSSNSTGTSGWFRALVVVAGASLAWRMYHLRQPRRGRRVIDGWSPCPKPAPVDDVQRHWLPRGTGVVVPNWERTREREQLKAPPALVARYHQV